MVLVREWIPTPIYLPTRAVLLTVIFPTERTKGRRAAFTSGIIRTVFHGRKVIQNCLNSQAFHALSLDLASRGGYENCSVFCCRSRRGADARRFDFEHQSPGP